MMGNSLFVLTYLLARVQITRSNDEYFTNAGMTTSDRKQLTSTINLSVSRVFTVKRLKKRFELF